MKRRIKTFSRLLALAMTVAVLFAFAQPAFAASVKTNVVTQIRFKSYAGTGYYSWKFQYNSKGLLTQKTSYQADGAEQYQIKYKYNSDYLVKSAVVKEFGKKMADVTYTYNKNKQVTKRVTKFSNVSVSISTKYTYKNGVLSKSVQTFNGASYYPAGTKITKNYTFNKKGVLTKISTEVSSLKESNGVNTYKYDANGFLTKYTYKNGFGEGYITRKLTYKNDLLKKYKDTDHAEGETYSDNQRSLTWKSVSTPKAALSIVKQQQQELINGSYGTNVLLGYDYM